MTEKQIANKKINRRRAIAWSISAFLLACVIDAFVYEPYHPVLTTDAVGIANSIHAVVSRVLHSECLSCSHSKGHISTYVNRGISTISYQVRFRCRPEVALFILHPTRQSRPYIMRV